MTEEFKFWGRICLFYRFDCLTIVISFCSEDEFAVGKLSRAAQKEITQQLIKDGYNLDLEPDDEDLDLIPPKPLNERCVCCQVPPQNYCTIQ